MPGHYTVHGAHVHRRHAGPPHRAARQGERLVATVVPAERRCASVELMQHLRAQRARRRHAKAIAAPAAAVEQPVAATRPEAQRDGLAAERGAPAEAAALGPCACA